MNNVKQKLKKGLPAIGTWLQLPDVSVAEIIGSSGYDWAAIDFEHGSFSPEKTAMICLALEKGDTTPFARLAQVAQKDIKQALDAGIKGLIFPMITTAEELAEGISWAKYPPFGKRGVGYSRANLFGKHFENQVPEDSNQLVIIAQIEHIDACQNINDILKVNGLDGIMIGPYDLSASMGITAQFDHPDFLSVIDTVKISAEKNSIPMGLHIVQPNQQLLHKKITEGYRFIAYGIDAVFLYTASECPSIEV